MRSVVKLLNAITLKWRFVKPSRNCFRIIKKFEGLVLTAYRDKAGMWKIGYGCTIYENGRRVRIGHKISKQRADRLIKSKVNGFSIDLAMLIRTQLNQNQFDALVSFAYSIGLDFDNNGMPQGLGDSTMLKLINQNRRDQRIRSEFLKWNKITVNGRRVVDADLMRRRLMEVELYFKPV